MAARSDRRRHAARNRASAPPRRRRRWLWALLVVPVLALAALGLLAFYLVFSSVPLQEDIAAVSSVVYDVDGQEVGGLASEIAREDIELADLPPHVVEAVLAAEDRSFYEHRGISLPGIARALFTNVRAGEIQGGGSTITQQYIKNAQLSSEQTYRRKVEEAALAIKLERQYEKDQILTFYLNTAYWGRGTTGIEAAARTYFDTPASELSVNQAATLAGLLPAPEAYDPLDNPDDADARRRYVLDGMLSEGYLSRQEHETAVAEGLPEVTDAASLDRGPNAYYLDAVRRELTAQPQFGQGELFRGLRVYTELDQRLQRAAQQTLTEAIVDGPTDSGAITSVDPATGGVRALAGGPDIQEQPFNTAIRAVRPPGSTFKAFTLQAFVEAGFGLDSRYPAPAEIQPEDAQGPITNFGGASFGEQSVRQATASSTNTVFVQMQEEIGRDRVISAARAAGLPGSKQEEVYPTERGEGQTMEALAGLTLGQDEFSPLEMTAAYATYAAEGTHATPHLVTRVEDADGRIVYEPDATVSEPIDPDLARAVTDALRDVVTSGSGRAAALEDRPVAGKTGTTNDARDVWFVGYVPQLATGVWLGNLDNSAIEAENATGGALAAPVWHSYMTQAVEGMEVLEFTPPGEIELEDLRDEPDECPEGYRYAQPPNEADEDGFFPDVLTERTDDDGRPCVETKPELEDCPEGYEYGPRPTGEDEGDVPDVIEGQTDFQGRPCVEIVEDEPEDDGGEGEGEDDGGDDGQDGDGDGGQDDGGDSQDGNGGDGTDGGDGDGGDGGGDGGDGQDDGTDGQNDGTDAGDGQNGGTDAGDDPDDGEDDDQQAAATLPGVRPART